MTRTPWGDATELRDRMLRPGRGMPRDEADRNQRERLFAATVAAVSEKGFEATTVADLVELSGVSRSAFYRHFADKRECFVAAIGSLVDPALGTLETGAGSGDLDSAKAAFETLLGKIVGQPAAAKMCFVEVYAAGSEGVAMVDRTLDGFEVLVSRILESA